MAIDSTEKKTIFEKEVTISIRKILHMLLSTVLITALLTALTYQTIRTNIREKTPEFLGGWYLDSASEFSDETLPYSYDFRKNVVDIKNFEGEVVTCSYSFSYSDRTIIIQNYYGTDIYLRYSIQPLIHFWSESDDERKADYLFAG